MRWLRRLTPLPLVASLFATVGCTSSTLDYFELHGSLASGAGINQRVVPNIGVVPSLQPQVGIVLAVGVPLGGPEDFRGVRLEWVQTAVAAGGTYPSSPDGPVIFYAVEAQAGGSTLDTTAFVINGGSVTFATIDPKTTTGTVSGMVLSRGGQTILTIDSGAFQATNP